MRSSSSCVWRLPWWIANDETISDAASPAPWRCACRRTNQLPMPASGASITRFGIVRPPRVQGSVRRLRIERPAYSAIALVQQPQPGEREQVVDLIDRVREGHDRAGQAAGG